MNYQCEEARLSGEEIAEIRRNMEARGLTSVFCQACSEEMKPEKARKSDTGLITCRPCYMCNDTDATQKEIDQALEEDFPGYLASFKSAMSFLLPSLAVTAGDLLTHRFPAGNLKFLCFRYRDVKSSRGILSYLPTVNFF